MKTAVKALVLALYVFAFWCLFLAPLASCKETLPPEPDYVVYPPYQEAGADVNVEIVQIPADCRVACENLAKLGCPESAPAPGGRSCNSVCAAALEQGIDMPTICVANASTPDQVRACGMIKCKGR